MRIQNFAFVIAIATLAAARPGAAQPGPAPAMGYARSAALAEAANMVADVTITRATRLKGPQAAGVPAGMARFYLEGEVGALIRGAAGSPSAVSWLADAPLDARGKPPKLRKSRVLLLAATTARPGELRLAAPDAQLAWTPETDRKLREILKAMVAPDAPPRIAGIANAFYVPGSLPGESETQIFLTTVDGRPVSLNVLRRPGEEPRWAVALGEMVDDSAQPPARDTLLWYRLACFLPDAVPDAAVAELDADGAAAVRADYRVVQEGLGTCPLR